MPERIPQAAEDPETADLVEAARSGDAAAFAAIHRRFARVVHGIALARVGPGDADDVAQEVFMRLHGALADLRDPGALPGWLCAVARRAAIDHLRRRRPRPSAHLEEVPAPGAWSARDAEVLRRRVLEHLQGLPEGYRETLVLRLVEGMTGPEIAAATGMTPGSVRVNLHRGMSLLRPLLRKDGW